MLVFIRGNGLGVNNLAWQLVIKKIPTGKQDWGELQVIKKIPAG